MGLRREIKNLKKEVRRAKRMAAGEDFDDEESEEEVEEEKEDMEEVEITCTKEEVGEAINREMEETEQFGMEERGLQWSPSEVCFWLKSIQMEPYMRVFYSAQIFGDVLLQDIGKRMLAKFKVTSMHSPKLLRQIDSLRQKVRERGVQIDLSEEIIRENNPNLQESRSKKNKKSGGSRVNNKQYQELERKYNEERERYD